MQLRLSLSAAIVACGLSGCARSPDRQEIAINELPSGVVTVYAVNYPLQNFAERIGGSHVRVVFPAPADQDPAFWMPDAETIAAYQQADLILLNGARYAKWTETVSLPAAKLLDTSLFFSDQYIKVEDALRHVHGPGGEHSHAGTAFTTWLDPHLALAQADAIRQALVKLRPQLKDTFESNFAGLASDLTELDASISEIVQERTDRRVVFSHPVYQYLTRRYNLNAESVHWEPDEVPSTEMWDEFTAGLARHPAKWVIWEGEPVEESVNKLAELGLQSVVFDPCGNVPEDGDFMDVMRRNVADLQRVFAE